MTSWAQRLVTRLLPGRAAEIESESREWIATCPTCGHERDIWEMGGVRYKARSRGKRIFVRCPSCDRRGAHRVERRPGSDAGSPEPSQ